MRETVSRRAVDPARAVAWAASGPGFQACAGASVSILRQKWCRARKSAPRHRWRSRRTTGRRLTIEPTWNWQNSGLWMNIDRDARRAGCRRRSACASVVVVAVGNRPDGRAVQIRRLPSVADGGSVVRGGMFGPAGEQRLAGACSWRVGVDHRPCAPQAASSSAFQAAGVGSAGHDDTACPQAPQKTGSFASGSTARVPITRPADCKTSIDDPLDFGAARAAIGAGVEFACRRPRRCGSRRGRRRRSG